MYQLLIIDDEEIVRKGIEQLIPWEEEGFMLCDEAEDGITGLEKVMEHQPDLVLVDIKMPGMSGLELIQAAKERGFPGKCVILTGYSDFAFAKQAISLQVEEYLLKPIDEDELLAIVRKVYQRLEENKKNEVTRKQDFLQKVILNMLEEEQWEQPPEEFRESLYCVAIVSDKERIEERNPLLYKQKIEMLENRISDVIAFDLERQRIMISLGVGFQEFRENLISANQRVKQKYGEDFFISIGQDVVSWRDLCFSYECAWYLTGYEFLFPQNRVLSIEEMNLDMQEKVDIQPEFLFQLMEVGNMEKVLEEMEKLRDYCKAGMLREDQIKARILMDLLTIWHLLEKNYPQRKQEFLDANGIYNEIRNTTNLEELINWTEELLCRLSEIIGTNDNSNTIKRVYYYMQKNYDKNLKLEKIAELFHYNSAYLGKIFRKEMGEGFNNVLDSIRLEHAKQLLAESGRKVYEVAEQVGYSNIDYFYLKFKKQVGISPKEFQKQHNKL